MSDPNIILKPKIKATERYKKYLQIASIFLPKPLTPVQIDILDEIYQKDGVINTESRKHVKEALNKSSEQINNYILDMRKNGIIIDDKINPQLLPPIPAGKLFSVAINMQITV